MESQIELRVLELLCSRLCHDLISPVSAINNGMELLAEGDDGMAQEIHALLATSAGAASAKLQFYRLEYGLGGQAAAPTSLAEAARLVRGLTAGEKVEIVWPGADQGAAPDLSREETKLLLNMVLLGLEGLPRGGTLTVGSTATVGDTAPGDRRLVVSGTGKGAGLKPESTEALAIGTDIGGLTARTVQSYFVAVLARDLGTVAMHHAVGSGEFSLNAALAG